MLNLGNDSSLDPDVLHAALDALPEKWLWPVILLLCLLLMAACDEREIAQKRQADAPRQLQELRHQLEQERAQRLRAEQAAAAAAQSRASWIAGLAAAGIIGCVLAGAWGIHIGSRAVAHYRKENADVL